MRTNEGPGPAVPGPEAPACGQSVCITCSDEAVPVRVVEALSDGIALVDAGGESLERVSADFVDFSVGDTLLVHAGVAIGKLR